MTATAAYLHNRSPSRPLQDITPYQKAKGSRLNLAHLRIPGCRVYSHIPKETRKGKLTDRGKEAIFVGYTESPSIYLLYDSIKRTTYRSRDTYFIEDIPEVLVPI